MVDIYLNATFVLMSELAVKDSPSASHAHERIKYALQEELYINVVVLAERFNQEFAAYKGTPNVKVIDEAIGKGNSLCGLKKKS